MLKPRWLLALPLAFAVTIGAAHASSIRDGADLFDPDVVREAEAKLNQVERDTGVTTTIETIPSLEGQSLDNATLEHARRSKTEGIFILIPKQDRKIRTFASKSFVHALTRTRLAAIDRAFTTQFKDGNFDAGLKDGVQTITREISAAQAETGGRLRRAEGPPAVPVGRGRPMPRPGGNAFGLGSLLGIGLVIIAVLIGIRLLGSLFGGGRGAYGPGVGRPGMGPGYGPGPGPGYGPGYGGRGGGFLSSLFGGIGGAMAGNWLYDQFSGRHHGGSYADNTAYTPGPDASPTDVGGDEWSGGTGVSGDWGGGDAGGGGDWGGGGDAGGGDWGGGGGGDWGGGGGDGGSW